MEISKYKAFISNIEEKQKESFEAICLKNIDDNDKRAWNITKILVLSIVIYYVFRFDYSEEFNFFGLSIKSKELLLHFLPSFISILGFVWMNIQMKLLNLRIFLNQYWEEKYKIENTNMFKPNWFVFMMTPIAASEFSLMFSGKWSVLNLPYYLIAFVIYASPLIVIGDGIGMLWNLSNKNFMEYIFLGTTIGFLFYSIVTFIKPIVVGVIDHINNKG